MYISLQERNIPSVAYVAQRSMCLKPVFKCFSLHFELVIVKVMKHVISFKLMKYLQILFYFVMEQSHLNLSFDFCI